MALTEEQIKNIQAGDTVLVEAHVNRVTATGCDVSHGCISHQLPFSVLFQVPAPPKHDPCRLFKKGDKATPRIVNGRNPVCGIDGVAAKINSVELIIESNEGERENGTVDIKFPCGTIGQIDPVYLELVTPVEELEPYIAYENLHVCAVMHRDEKDGKFIAVFFISHYGKTIARERAEAECARLNAEYRKDHV